jgi:hypothetical protein
MFYAIRYKNGIIYVRGVKGHEQGYYYQVLKDGEIVAQASTKSTHSAKIAITKVCKTLA